MRTTTFGFRKGQPGARSRGGGSPRGRNRGPPFLAKGADDGSLGALLAERAGGRRVLVGGGCDDASPPVTMTRASLPLEMGLTALGRYGAFPENCRNR